MSIDRLKNREEVYILTKDDSSGGLCPVDRHGSILSNKEIDNVITDLIKFKQTYDDVILEDENRNNLHDRFIIKNTFKQCNHAKGYVFIYKELITNKYRIVSTQNYKQRLKTLQYEYPTSLELIDKKYTVDTNLLKEILIEKYSEYKSHDNWFDLDLETIDYFKLEKYDEYFRERYKLLDNTIYETINCDICGKEVNNLQQKYYYECNKCRELYCSDMCLSKKHKFHRSNNQ